jgi:uncharacterized OsmC-like protein
MPSIQESGFPLAFRLAQPAQSISPPAAAGFGVWRTLARALDGMQKEALVAEPSGIVWRMTCDEGPYLNGTDLAPFPLAFFGSGMLAATATELPAAAREAGQPLSGLRLVQDNFYTMEGSALRGDMVGAALPVELTVTCDGGPDGAALQALVDRALAASPVAALLRTALKNRFRLVLNGAEKPLPLPAAKGEADDPAPLFDQAAPDASAGLAPDVLAKAESAEHVAGVDGGAGSSLTAEQKRMLHVRVIGQPRSDGLIALRVELFKPIGSSFTFLADPAGERAPSPLALTSAGLAFCYMTQLGRYAHIVKWPLADYRIVQDTRFAAAGGQGRADAVDTHVFLSGDVDEEMGVKLVRMGEQTCFLHAACRLSVGTNVTVEVAGRQLESRSAAG